MNRKPDFSDEFLNAFVDDELEANEKGNAFDAISRDTELKSRACEIRELKDMVRHAYRYPPHAAHRPPGGTRRLPGWTQAAAACLILVLGAASGWFARAWGEGGFTEHKLAGWENSSRVAASPHATSLEKVILHIGSDAPEKLRSGLDQAEHLLKAYAEAGQPIQLEIVANSGGLKLLRADVSPYAARVKSLQSQYRNVTFLACKQSIERLQEQGVRVHLLPGTEVSSSALDTIVTRMQQGWVYIKV